MGRLNEVGDELWEVATNAISTSLDEAIEDVERDLDEEDHHGHFVVMTLRRALMDRIEECRRND